MSYQIQVENIKCGGCGQRIRKQLLQLDAVDDLAIDVTAGALEITGDSKQREQVIQTLEKLGYPEVGSMQGLRAAGAKAKSFVSCAIGRLDNDA